MFQDWNVPGLAHVPGLARVPGLEDIPGLDRGPELDKTRIGILKNMENRKIDPNERGLTKWAETWSK